MTFEEAKIISNKLEASVDKCCAALAPFPRLSNGLVPDAVRSTVEYQAAKKDYGQAFEAMRKFNQLYVKQFKKELAAMRRTKYATN